MTINKPAVQTMQRSSSTDRLTEQIMVLGKEHSEYMKKLSYHKRMCEEQYKSRTRPTTPVIPRNNTSSQDDHQSYLADQYQLEDRWWLSSSCKTFLETREIPFGRKNVFLISKKNSPISNPELRQKKSVKTSGNYVQVDSGFKGIVNLSLAECKYKLTNMDINISEQSDN